MPAWLPATAQVLAEVWDTAAGSIRQPPCDHSTTSLHGPGANHGMRYVSYSIYPSGSKSWRPIYSPWCWLRAKHFPKSGQSALIQRHERRTSLGRFDAQRLIGGHWVGQRIPKPGHSHRRLSSLLGDAKMIRISLSIPRRSPNRESEYVNVEFLREGCRKESQRTSRRVLEAEKTIR